MCEIIHVPTDMFEVTSSVKFHCKAMFRCGGGVFLLKLVLDVENNGNQTRKKNAMEEELPSVVGVMNSSPCLSKERRLL